METFYVLSKVDSHLKFLPETERKTPKENTCEEGNDRLGKMSHGKGRKEGRMEVGNEKGKKNVIRY
jgi:hypothetical protein